MNHHSITLCFTVGLWHCWFLGSLADELAGVIDADFLRLRTFEAFAGLEERFIIRDDALQLLRFGLPELLTKGVLNAFGSFVEWDGLLGLDYRSVLRDENLKIFLAGAGDLGLEDLVIILGDTDGLLIQLRAGGDGF